MEIRRITQDDAEIFSKLIIDMYGHLDCLDWFSPMPHKVEDVREMIGNPRLFIIGAFENDELVGIASMDYKCGKLIGKIDFPKDCNTDKLVEFGFGMVHSAHRGNGILKIMLKYLLEEAKKQGFEWVFGKVHLDNLASSKSLLANGFFKHLEFAKPSKVADLNKILDAKILSAQATEKIEKRLEENPNAETLDNSYQILIRRV